LNHNHQLLQPFLFGVSGHAIVKPILLGILLVTSIIQA
jgi:hypothetical protein